MRPLDLRPPEDQGSRGSRVPMRTGSAPYVVIGALVALTLGAAAWALTSKTISDKEAEVATLEQEEVEASARAEALSPFANFRAVQETRQATITSLAQSRFDWERVMRELALVIPSDVWLVNLSGSVAAGVTVDGAAEIPSRDSVAGPALEIVGCAPSQDSTAAFAAALEDIDGVTRVGVALSGLDDADQAAAGGEASDDDCRTRDFIVQFELVVAFDAVPVPATAQAAPAVPAPVAPGGDAAAPAQQAASSSATDQVAEGQQAANLAPGG